MRRDDLQPFGNRQPGRIGGGDESGEALRPRCLAGACENDIEVGDAAIRDPGLLASEAVSVAITDGLHRDIRDVGARF